MGLRRGVIGKKERRKERRKGCKEQQTSLKVNSLISLLKNRILGYLSCMHATSLRTTPRCHVSFSLPHSTHSAATQGFEVSFVLLTHVWRCVAVVIVVDFLGRSSLGHFQPERLCCLVASFGSLAFSLFSPPRSRAK